jgi:hypothetical protein
MIPVSLFYVLISWVVVLLLKLVMDQLFESQSYEILDNQTQFFQEHSTETDKLCVETLKLKDKLCLLSLFFFIIFIPHICIFSFSHTWLFNNIHSTLILIFSHLIIQQHSIFCFNKTKEPY